MLKKIKNVSFTLKSIDNPYETYSLEINNYWNQLVQKRKDLFNGDILSVCDL